MNERVREEEARRMSMQAELFCMIGRPAEALACATKATELDPSLAAGWINKAWACLGTGQYQEALASAEKGLALDPRSAMGWNNAGAALMWLGRYFEAIEQFSRAMSLDARHPMASTNREACLRQTESAHLSFLGPEGLDGAQPFLEQGYRVAVMLDFAHPGIDWRKVVSLANQHRRLVIADLVDRSVAEMRTMAERFAQWGAAPLALDLLLRAADKERRQ